MSILFCNVHCFYIFWQIYVPIGPCAEIFCRYKKAIKKVSLKTRACKLTWQQATHSVNRSVRRMLTWSLTLARVRLMLVTTRRAFLSLSVLVDGCCWCYCCCWWWWWTLSLLICPNLRLAYILTNSWHQVSLNWTSCDCNGHIVWRYSNRCSGVTSRRFLVAPHRLRSSRL